MHRSPDIWSLIIVWIGEHRGELISAGLAAIMAILRGMYAGGGRTQVMLDAAMCSLIAWFIEDVLTMFGVECNERCNSDPHPTPEIRSRG